MKPSVRESLVPGVMVMFTMLSFTGREKKMFVYRNTKYYFTDFHKGQTCSKSGNCLISTTNADMEER